MTKKQIKIGNMNVEGDIVISGGDGNVKAEAGNVQFNPENLHHLPDYNVEIDEDGNLTILIDWNEYKSRGNLFDVLTGYTHTDLLVFWNSKHICTVEGDVMVTIGARDKRYAKFDRNFTRAGGDVREDIDSYR